MKTIDEIRHAKLLVLIEEAGGLARLARKLDMASTSALSQYKNKSPDSKTGKPRKIGNNFARKLEKACDKSAGWMDSADSIVQTALNEFELRQKSASAWPFKVADRDRYAGLDADAKEWVDIGLMQLIVEAERKFGSSATPTQSDQRKQRPA